MSGISLKNSRILVTGANGFVGQNLVVRLNELGNINRHFVDLSKEDVSTCAHNTSP